MSEPRVLVTGVTGFVGHAVVDEFAAHGWEVLGVGRDDNPGDLSGQLVDYVSADLTVDPFEMPRVDAIVHLAGLAEVGPSFAEPQRYLSANSAMVTAICEGALASGRATRIVLASSGAVLAAPRDDTPLDESTPLGFASPYAVSKVLSENQISYYTQRGLDGVVARPFNHIGAGQRAGFLLPDLIAAVSEAQLNGGAITTGDLRTVRDYTDVRDVAAAYRLLATAPSLEHRLYNVCSGVGRSGQQILDEVLARMGAHDLVQHEDASRRRPSDARRIVGNPGRIAAELGWTRRYELADTIDEALASSHD
jgi:GDP-4-dehydro-6-deoxy-D-mannose reductase